MALAKPNRTGRSGRPVRRKFGAGRRQPVVPHGKMQQRRFGTEIRFGKGSATASEASSSAEKPLKNMRLGASEAGISPDS